VSQSERHVHIATPVRAVDANCVHFMSLHTARHVDAGSPPNMQTALASERHWKHAGKAMNAAVYVLAALDACKQVNKRACASPVKVAMPTVCISGG
jgi:hypothetical protein